MNGIFTIGPERRFVDELGGMNVFFVYDDATDEANEIATTSTAPNIAWETETMAGGVTPTVYPLSTKDTHMIDDTNLYVAVKVGSAIVWKYVALTTLEPH